MSILNTTRTAGRHCGKTPLQLKRELDQTTCELTRLTLQFQELGGAYQQLETAYDQVVAERDAALNAAANAKAASAGLGGENIALKARVQNLDPCRDLARGRAPIGPLTRVQPIRVMPLYEAPFAAVTNPGHVTGDAITLPVHRPAAA